MSYYIITCDVYGYYGNVHGLGVLPHPLLWGGEGEGEGQVTLTTLTSCYVITGSDVSGVHRWSQRPRGVKKQLFFLRDCRRL